MAQYLKDGPFSLSGSHRRWNLRLCLAVAQVALSLLVLVCAGLCVRSAQKLQAVDPGFEPARVVVMEMDVGQAGFPEARGRQFSAQLLDRVRALPGVETASQPR